MTLTMSQAARLTSGKPFELLEDETDLFSEDELEELTDKWSAEEAASGFLL